MLLLFQLDVDVREDVDPQVCHNAKQGKVRKSSNSSACNVCLLYLPITLSCPSGSVVDVNNYRCLPTSQQNMDVSPLHMLHQKLDARISNRVISDICEVDGDRPSICQEYASCHAHSGSMKHCMRTLRHHVVKRQIKFFIPDNSDSALF